MVIETKLYRYRLMPSLIRLEGVTKAYPMGAGIVYALKNVSLSIEKGEFVVVVGPSGSGKTTLLNLVGGIDRPSEGKVIVDEKDVTSMPENELTEFRRRYIGFVFQFFNLIPTLTALENVKLAAELVNNSLDPVEILKNVGLGNKLDHFPGQLSGGEQQRVAIARALVKNPPILLCDEPTGELDSETGRRILVILKRVNKEYGKSVLLVTHNTPISRMADRVIRLRNGGIVEERHVENPADPMEITW